MLADQRARSTLAALLLLAGTAAALAQAPARTTASPQGSGPVMTPPVVPAAPPGTVTGRQPLPPASQAVPRGQRTFARCNREALARKLRGADRRHFVTRCRLGYGLRLFRRRSAPPT